MKCSARFVGIVFLVLISSARAGGDEARFLSRVRQLTFEGKRSGEGYFSPDGKKIIFQSERDAENPFYQIYILDLTSGETHRVSPGTGKTTCSFFRPGTKKVLFASTHLDPDSAKLQKAELEFRASGKEKRYAWDYDEHYDIFEADEDGSNLKRLTEAQGYDAEGDYSPDGSKIVFCSMRAAYPLDHLDAAERKLAEVDLSYFGDIYIMNADGSKQVRLTDRPGYDGGPFFTPDGARIVWRHFETDGMHADVYTMKPDGSDVRRVTDFGAMSWAPYFHSSGDYLIFASNKLGFENFELFMTDPQGEKEPVRVTWTDGFDGLPVFSPDGKQLCWTSSRGGAGSGRKGGQLFLAQWNDAEARKALAEAPPRIAAGLSPTANQPALSHVSVQSDKSTSSTPSISSTLPQPENFTPAIDETDLKKIVGYLASDELEGRLTGSRGEKLAEDFIIRRFKEIGLKPLGDSGDYAAEFTFTSGVHPGKSNALSLAKIEPNPHAPIEDRAKSAQPLADFASGRDFLPLAFSDNGTTAGLVAFAGYGLVVPNAGKDPLYDSYNGLDVKGRIVVALRYVPEGISTEDRQLYNRYAGLRYKALQARSRGAAALLVVAGPNSPTSDSLVKLDLDIGGGTSGILAASINIATAEKLLASSGKTLKELQSALDPGKEKTAFNLEDAYAKLLVDLEKETSAGHNVIGVLPAAVAQPADPEFVMIGAHYDHLGRGPNSSSLAHKDEETGIHHGADDNASGVASILEIAQAMAADPAPRKRGIIFAAWSGEEIGLLGSADFTKHPPIALNQIAAYLNLDMVGRMRENKLSIQSVGSSPDWRKMIERKNIAAGFSLTLGEDPYLPTDSTSLYEKQVPALHFFSGAHEDYHRPTDTADKINYPDMARVAEFIMTIARDLAGGAPRPAYAKVEQSAPPGGGGREMLRAYIGSIPDYTSEDVKGVKLSGVRGGGPADKAGLKGGDIIVEFAGQKITNIYDYTYALDAVRIGEPVKVIVEREGKQIELTVIPEAKK